VTRERKITVKIPAGIATGQRLRIVGEGEHGTAGGPPGDLYVVMHVADHPVFQREEDELLCEVPVQFTTLALGGRIEVPTLDGTTTLDIPEGTSAGTSFRIRGKGMPNVSGRGVGDLHVTVSVIVPRKPSRDVRQALEDLRELLPDETGEPKNGDGSEAEKPFFERVKDIFG
jgi:molecular chaperone DnaJ